MLCKIECLSMEEMGSSDLGFILGENEQIGNHFIAYSSFQAFSDQLSQMSTCIKCFEIFGKLHNGWKWDFGEKIRLYIKSMKVQKLNPSSQLFEFIYCSSSLRQSIAQLSRVHPLSATPSSSVCQVLQFYPMFHFHGFIHCFTSPNSIVL